MKVFFDNCTSPTLAATLDGYIRSLGHSAHHICDLPCGRNAKDVEWIEMLANDNAVWIVITGDHRIRKNPPERAAFRQARLWGFALAPAYQKTPLNQVASTLVWRWPEMEKLAGTVAAPALFELPASRGGKIRSLPL